MRTCKALLISLPMPKSAVYYSSDAITSAILTNNSLVAVKIRVCFAAKMTLCSQLILLLMLYVSGLKFSIHIVINVNFKTCLGFH